MLVFGIHHLSNRVLESAKNSVYDDSTSAYARLLRNCISHTTFPAWVVRELSDYVADGSAWITAPDSGVVGQKVVIIELAEGGLGSYTVLVTVSVQTVHTFVAFFDHSAPQNFILSCLVNFLQL